MTITITPAWSPLQARSPGAAGPLDLSTVAGSKPGVPPSNQTGPHILLVTDLLHLPFGGAEHVLLKLVPRLIQQNYRVSILTFSIGSADVPLHAFSCPVYLLPLRKTYGPEALAAARQLRKFLRNNRVQIVQTFFESSDLWAGPVAKTLPGVKLIWSRRDMGVFRTPLHNAAYKLLATLPDAVLAVSEQVRQHCIHNDGIDPSSVRTIYNGLDSELWSLRPAPDSSTPSRPLHIATVGNIRRVKGLDILIRAATDIVRQFPDVYFTIAGDVLEPEYLLELQQLLESLNLVEKFRFLGSISDLPKHLAQADLFVLPSRSEGLSNALLEAMAASLPVVATRVGGNAESVVEGVTGTIVPPDDAPSLAGAVCEILQHPGRARQMGESGRQRVRESFSVHAMVAKTVDVYKTLLTPVS